MTLAVMNRALAPLASEAEGLALALRSGGDERVFLDPATGRTKYGTPPLCAEDEIWFSSSTAAAITPRGRDAAATAWQDILCGDLALEDCCDGIRSRLLRLFGIDGAEAILTGSGTEAILASVVLAHVMGIIHLTTIIVGLAETGRGVSKAASARNFVRHAPFAEVDLGARLAGFDKMDFALDSVEIRDERGALRAAVEIESELAQKVETARKLGREVIIHRLDVSKTGQSAPGLSTLSQLCERDSGHVFALADCCQLRCSTQHVQNLLSRGFLVAITGSKFAGGPAFCGALLVPPTLLARIERKELPQGLAAFGAQLDWPAALRARLPLGFLGAANLGLALRWEAALAEIERFFAWPADLRTKIMFRFYENVARRAATASDLALLAPSAANGDCFGHTILGVTMRHADCRCFDMTEAAAIQRHLREGRGENGQSGRVHLGQPVEIGKAGVLRVCASAPLVNDIAERIETGFSFKQAFAPVEDGIADLFHAWAALVAADPQ
jgi:hypothetical protein